MFITKSNAPFWSSKTVLQLFISFSRRFLSESSLSVFIKNSVSFFTTVDAPALVSIPYMSRKFLIEGPDIVGTLYIVASRGLCPPVLLKLPPINAISHIA